MDVDKPRSDLSAYPWATLLVVFFSLIGGLVTIIDESSLNFEEYLTAVLAASAALSIGRGLAYKSNDVDATPLSRFLNSLPWATLLIGIFSLVGAIVLVIGESELNFEEYLTRVMAAAAVLGIGRGIASYKKDHSLINTEPDSAKTDFKDYPQPEEVPPPLPEEMPEEPVGVDGDEFEDEDIPPKPEGGVGGKPGEVGA